MWLAKNKDGSLRIFARPPRRFHDGTALEPQKVGFNDTITLGNDDYSFWAIQEYCDSNRIDDFRNYGIDIRTAVIRNGKEHFIPYIPECARHITWEDEPVEVEIIQKSLKERVQPQQKWSEEDEKTIHNIDTAIRHEVVFPIDELKSMEIWLESLKYRICPKHEWKRDEKMFQLIEDIINVYRKTQGSVIGGIHTEELKYFLNCMSSRQDWNPSDEQIEILDMVLTNESMDDNIARILRELKEQLKKLREE